MHLDLLCVMGTCSGRMGTGRGSLRIVCGIVLLVSMPRSVLVVALSA